MGILRYQNLGSICVRNPSLSPRHFRIWLLLNFSACVINSCPFHGGPLRLQGNRQFGPAKAFPPVPSCCVGLRGHSPCGSVLAPTHCQVVGNCPVLLVLRSSLVELWFQRVCWLSFVQSVFKEHLPCPVCYSGCSGAALQSKRMGRRNKSNHD